MYCYLYDTFTQDREHERTLTAIEHRITDLGLQGKIVRLALFRDPVEALRREVAGGVKTVVCVGNDDTVRRVLDVAVETGVAVAVLPVGDGNVLARVFGIPVGVEACDVLSQRIIETLDVGVVNGKRFLSGVRIERGQPRVRSERGYSVLAAREAPVEVRNLCTTPPSTSDDIANPFDGCLDVVIHTTTRKGLRRQEHQSCVPLDHVTIEYDAPVVAQIDGEPMEATMFDVAVQPKAFKVIVGRERMI